MRILRHDKATVYRRLAEEARTIGEQISIKHSRGKHLTTAQEFEFLGDPEAGDVRKSTTTDEGVFLSQNNHSPSRRTWRADLGQTEPLSVTW